MKLWVKSVKLAVRKEAIITHQEFRDLNVVQSREIMTRLGNLAGTIQRQRQTKIDQ